MTPMVKIDPDKGQRYFSNKTCCSIFINEGFGLAETNSSGWFGKEFRDSGLKAISVAVLGNSFVAARQVFDRDNFISIAEKEITGKTDIPVSFNNFGKESVTLREALLIKEEIDATYNPDYYAVLVNETFFGSEGRSIPYYELKESKLRLNTEFKESFFVKQYEKLQYIAKSSVFFLIFRVKNRLPQLYEIVFDKLYWGQPKETARKKDYTIDVLDKTLLEEFDKDKRVVFFLDLDSVRRDKVKMYVKNSPVIDLKQPLLNLKKERGIDPYYWEISNQTGHWNRSAHWVVGQELAKSMLVLLDSKRLAETR